VKKLVLTAVVLISFQICSAAGFSAFLGGGLGATMPQGEFNEYTKTGFSMMGYGKLNMSSLPFLSYRLGLQGVFFERDDRMVIIQDYPDAIVTETYTNDLFKATLGLELSPSFLVFKPYVGAGIGIYYFSSKTQLKDEDGDVMDTKTLDTKTKFGWNLQGGLRFAIFPKITLDLNLQYDIVQDLEQYSGDEVVSFNSEFLSLFAGVQVSLGLF
jgi:opacity protein-like surface antigen